MRKFLFLTVCFLLALIASAADAQSTYTAASCSFADVNDCVNHGGANTCSPGGSHTAIAGDIIKVPPSAGTPCTWGTNTAGDAALQMNVSFSLLGGGLSASNSWNEAGAWMQMNTSSAGTTLTPAILTAGTVGNSFTYVMCTLSGACNDAASAPGFTVDNSQNGMGGSITVGIGGTNFPIGTTTKSLNLAGTADFTYFQLTGFPSGQTAMTVNGVITFGVPNVSTTAQNMDLVSIYDNNGHFAVLQFNPGNANGSSTQYAVRIETDGNGTQRSNNQTITPGNTYFFSLLFDGVGGTARAALFDPTNNMELVGGQIMSAIQKTGGTIGKVNIGNAEVGTTSTGSIHFENISYDWTNHIFPNYPQSQDTGQTVLYDNNFKGDSSCHNDVALINVASTTNTLTRIAGFTISQLATDPNQCQPGHISFNGSSTANRFDHNTLQNLSDDGVRTFGGGYGVIDHNQLGTGTSSGAGGNPIEVTMPNYGGTGNWGDDSWALPDTIGTQAAWYIETNTFGQNLLTQNDGLTGARLVSRFNFGGGPLDEHGLESTGRGRSVRQFEIYGDTFFNTPSQSQGTFIRGGTGIICCNSYTNNSTTSGYNPPVSLIVFRETDNFSPWAGSPAQFGTTAWGEGACDGASYYDTVDGGSLAPTQYATGSAGASSSLDNMTPTSSPGWTVNQWVNYTIRNITKNWGGVIASNTAGTIVTEASQHVQTVHNWSSGDSYVILRATRCADQPGAGAGLLLRDFTDTNGEPVLNSTGAAGAVAQATDPIYGFLNVLENATGNGAGNNPTPGASPVNTAISSRSQHVVTNRDFYDYVGSVQVSTSSPFNGTSGVGVGTLAQMPSSCSGQTGYWATDQGSWNTSGNGFGNGVLYQCQGGTFAVYWTPLGYPHPLVGGSVTLSCPTTAFGSVTLGQSSSPTTCTLANNSSSTATSINPVTTTGNSTDFVIVNSGAGSCNAAGNSIAASASCTFTVKFTPGGVGARATSLSVGYSGGDLNSPQTTNLSGTGVASTTIIGATSTLGVGP